MSLALGVGLVHVEEVPVVPEPAVQHTDCAVHRRQHQWQERITLTHTYQTLHRVKPHSIWEGDGYHS